MSNTTPAIRYLSATPTEYTPELAIGKYPPTRNGIPCFYYRKDVIEPDTYIHPVKQWSLGVEPADIDGFVDTFQQMKANGVDVPIVKDHNESADSTLGYIVDMSKGNDGRLYAVHQFMGEEARDVGLKNHVSVGIDPDFSDGRGVKYGKAIRHVAATPVPVVPNQGEFLIAASRAAAADTGSTVAASPVLTQGAPTMGLTFSTEHADAIIKLVPGLDGVADAEKPAKIVSYLNSLAQADDIAAGGPSVVANLSRAEISHKATTNRNALKDENARLLARNTELGTQVRELSAKVVKELDPEARDAIVDSAEVKFSNLVERGQITPAVRDRLFSLLVKEGEKANPLTLSRAANPRGDKPLAFAIADVLSDLPSNLVGESTGLQTLSRQDVETDEQKAKKDAAAMLKKHLSGASA